MPVTATAYYVWRFDTVYTFIGGGVGGMMSNRTLDAQAEQTKDTSWYVSATGLAVAVLEITPGFGLETKLRYVGGYKSDAKPIGMVQWTLGFVFFY